MSEEQSGFKVTDRRLFNPDGTPREVAQQQQEEKPAPQAATPAEVTTRTTSEAASSATEAESAAASSSSSATERGATSDAARQATAGSASSASATGEDELPGETYGEGDIPGANDPASFVNFLMSIASNAAAALGMMEHPVTGERGVDLALGKHWIDVLGMLQEKTSGNLSAPEQQIFTGLLSDLRMQFVSLTRASTQKRPGGFTGSDILGGK
jgi:Domain of unknown function (DUF1844)